MPSIHVNLLHTDFGVHKFKKKFSVKGTLQSLPPFKLKTRLDQLTLVQ